MKLMIDTNVILDILLKREPFFEDSYQIIKLYNNGRQLYFSATAATDIYYLLRRSLGNEKAKDLLEKIMQLMICADTQQGDILNALASGMDDFEDAVVDAVASRIKADYIITRNIKDFSKSKVKAFSPAEFLSRN